MEILLILGRTLEKQKLNISCSAPFHTKTRFSFKYSVNDCSVNVNELLAVEVESCDQLSTACKSCFSLFYSQ